MLEEIILTQKASNIWSVALHITTTRVQNLNCKLVKIPYIT